jgi:aspartate/methionine/tyrosine aminotransferase
MRDPQAINLAVGQPCFPPPPQIAEALKSSAGGYAGYTETEGLPELRKAIKAKLLRENRVRAKEALVTAGAVEACFDFALSRLSPGSEAITLSPHYGKYETPARIARAKLKKIPLKKWRPDLDALERAITKKTRLITINTPNNPTGLVYTEEELKRIAEAAERHGVPILADETYEKFAYGGRRHVSLARFTTLAATANSLSKTYGFPGLRLGYLAGAEELILPAREIHASNTTCLPEFTQKAALAALRSGFSPPASEFESRAKLAASILGEAGIFHLPCEGAFYAYAYVRDARALCASLLREKVLLMPSAMFGDEKQAVRICYAAPPEKLEAGLRALSRLA